MTVNAIGKAKNAVYVGDSLGSKYPQTWGYSSLRWNFNSTYSGSIWVGDNQSKSISKGQTNWDTGDIILCKSYIQVWLRQEVAQPSQEIVNMTTGYRLLNENKDITMTSVDLKFTDNKTASCSATPLDVFSIKYLDSELAILQGNGSFTLEQVYVPFFSYFTSPKARLLNGRSIIQGTRLVIEATYIGTEQADGSVIYQA